MQEEEEEESIMSLLPLEILLNILCHVPAQDLLVAAPTCRLWWEILKPTKNAIDLRRHSVVTTLSSSLSPYNQQEDDIYSPVMVQGTRETETGGEYNFESDQHSRPCKKRKLYQQSSGSLSWSIEEVPSVWKLKATRFHFPWAESLLSFHKGISSQCDFRWLCLACERLVTYKEISGGYTGTGIIVNYQANALHPNELLEVNTDHVEEDVRGIAGAVKYMNSYVGDIYKGRLEGFGILRPSCVLLQPANQPHVVLERNPALARQGQQQGQQQVQLIHEQVAEVFDYYVGEWRSGQQYGDGFCSWSQGKATYRGKFRKGMRHGQGEYNWYNGTRYRGDFKRNNIWGEGEYTWPNGNIVGNWKLNKQHGKCTIEWKNTGCLFEGVYKYGIRKKGTYRWSDGGIYQGEWNDHEREGKAHVQFANGLSFVGTYLHDVREGEGTLTWPNGDYFQGTWSLGRRWGKGIYYDKATKVSYEQNWREDTSVRYSIEGARRFPDKTK